MKQVLYNLYDIHELSPEAKQKAIFKHYEFLTIMGIGVEGEMIVEDYDPTDEEVLENIEANNYLFYADGRLADVIHYVGAHPKAGTKELRIGLDVYPII